MSRPIYEPSLQRTDARLGYGSNQLFRRPAQPTACPCFSVFRAAMGSIADPETDRVHYLSDDDADAVYWDQWDTTFDTTIFDTGPYEQTINGIDVIGGVGLKQIGNYSIHAVIDLDEYMNGIVLLGTNFDEGQGNPTPMGNVALAGEPFWGDSGLTIVDQWRQVVDLPPPDFTWGGEATDVQITFSFSSTTAMPGVSPGKKTSPTTVSPGDDMWIPGGYDGAYGYVPNLEVKYWGFPEENYDAEWPDSFPK